MLIELVYYSANKANPAEDTKMKRMLNKIWNWLSTQFSMTAKWIEDRIKSVVWFLFRKTTKICVPAIILVGLLGYAAYTGSLSRLVLPTEKTTVRGYEHHVRTFLGFHLKDADYLVVLSKTGWEKSVRIYPSAPGFKAFEPGDRIVRDWNFKFEKLAQSADREKILVGNRLLPAPPLARPADLPNLPQDVSSENLKVWAKNLVEESQTRGERFDDLVSRVKDALRLASAREVPDEQTTTDILYGGLPSPPKTFTVKR